MSSKKPFIPPKERKRLEKLKALQREKLRKKRYRAVLKKKKLERLEAKKERIRLKNKELKEKEKEQKQLKEKLKKEKLKEKEKLKKELKKLKEKEKLKEKKKKEKEKAKLRKIEKEKKKKEKEKAKKHEKSIERHKKKMVKIHRKHRIKLRDHERKRRKKLGDVYGYYVIMIVKNKKRVKKIAVKRWKTDAYEIFNSTIEKNHSEVKFPIQFLTDDKNGKHKTKYEVILLQKISPDEENITQFRNEDGKFIDNVVADNDGYVILAKDDWYLEESFNVYGYHPVRDRKNFDFILNEIVLKDIEGKNDIRTLMIYQNKLFIRYIGDFDFVICKTIDDSRRLYSTIEKNIPKEYKKNFIFIDEINQNRVSFLLEEMMEKTGWSRDACSRPYV